MVKLPKTDTSMFSEPQFNILPRISFDQLLTNVRNLAEKDCPIGGQNIPNVQFSTTLVCCPPPPCRLSSEPRPRTPGILNTVSIHPPSESRPLTSDMSPLCLEFKPLKLWPSEENPSIRSQGEVYPGWTPYSPHVNDTKTHAMYPIVLSCTASLVICHHTMHTHARHQHWDSSFHRLQPPISAFQSTKLDSLIRRPSLREKVQSIGIHF